MRFVIYQLRTSYLTHTQDGIGERLINVDTSVLNDPAFRAAGWVPNEAAIKRTYSPPIPTSGAADYFQAPPRSAGLPGTPGIGDDEDDAAVVGTRDSNDTVGPAPIGGRRNRRRKEQLRQEEEEDSSDLSDESNDETAESTAASVRPANSIRFAKMPVRGRADSSPARARERAASSPERPGSEGEQRDGPSVMVTSPSRPPERNWSRRENWGASQAMKPRARRDTATSSEVSSEGDSLDPSVFKRKSIKKPGSRRLPHRVKGSIAEESHEIHDESTRPSTAGSEEVEKSDLSTNFQEGRSEDDEDLSDGMSIASSGFSEDDDNPLLKGVPSIGTVSLEPGIIKSPLKSHTPSPRKNKSNSNPERPDFQELPPPRPISTIQPVSALAAAIKAKNRKPGNVFDRFTSIDGEKAPNPLYIKIYVPSAEDADEPMELQMRKTSNDGHPVIVADAIGYALLRYTEEDLQPKISGKNANVNKWTFRIVDDGEVDDDFPPLGRTKPMSDFTMNNNRPARGRARDRPWDEFALVLASDEQLHVHERETPIYSVEAREAVSAEPITGDVSRPTSPVAPSTVNSSTTINTRSASHSVDKPPSISSNTSQIRSANAPTRAPSVSDPPPPRSSSFAATSRMARPPAQRQNTNPMPFIAPLNTSTTTAATTPLPYVRPNPRQSQLMDAPSSTAQTSAQRSGAPRTLHIHFTTADGRPHVTALEVTADTYISEVFDTVTKRFGLDKGLYVLRVSGLGTVAPPDRMVEALGSGRNDLDLTRRRFGTDGMVGLSGSPGSTSPHAPLLLTHTGTPTKGTRAKRGKKVDGETGFAGGFTGGFAGYTTTTGGGAIYGQGAHPLATQADALAGASVGLGYRRWTVTRKQPMSFTPSAPRVLAIDGETLYIMPPEGGGRKVGAGVDDKTRAVPFESVVGVKLNKKHARSFRVVVFRERGGDAKRYDFEARSGEEARDIVGVLERGVGAVKGRLA